MSFLDHESEDYNNLQKDNKFEQEFDVDLATNAEKYIDDLLLESGEDITELIGKLKNDLLG